MERPLTDAIVKHVWVPLPPDRAFHLFTSGMDTWWPLSSHSVSGAESSSVVFEEREGGRIRELTEDGVEHLWGTVLTWSPPDRLAFTWHPGREPSTAQRVDLRFLSAEEGTRVTLTHSGWEVLGDDVARVRPGYDTGWDFVLETCFGGAATRLTGTA